MIDAKELRIGNLIDYLGPTIVNAGIIQEIEKDGVENYANPIPLTEEWLVKVGFVKSMDENKNEYYIELHKCIGLLQIGYSNGRMYVSINSDEVELPNIKHAHQVQNLYVALTGEELKFSEE